MDSYLIIHTYHKKDTSLVRFQFSIQPWAQIDGRRRARKQRDCCWVHFLTSIVVVLPTTFLAPNATTRKKSHPSAKTKYLRSRVHFPSSFLKKLMLSPVFSGKIWTLIFFHWYFPNYGFEIISDSVYVCGFRVWMKY